MPLASTLGIFLLLVWPRANVVPSLSATPVWEMARLQESQSSDSSQQSSSTQAPAETQKTPNRSTATKPGAATSSPCPKNPPPGSSTKEGCKHAAKTKGKTQPETQERAAPLAAPENTVPTTVVRHGSTEDSDVILSSDPNPQASQQSDRTKQLLESSDANLKKMSVRPLSESQEDTVKQINSYMEQSKKATQDGQLQRAYNLAVKANLLSAELTKGH